MKRRIQAIFTIFILALTCCSGDSSGSLDITELEGRYDITGPVDTASNIQIVSTPTCTVEVSSSFIVAKCSKNFREASESLDVDVRLDSAVITGELTYTYSNDSAHDPACVESYAETVQISGSATKDNDRTIDGVFSAVAGNWSGSITIDSQFEIEPAAGAAQDCAVEDNISTFNFSASVLGDSGQVSWQGDSDRGSFQVTGTNNSVSVDGDIITKTGG
jgi:hypothetical protein